MPGVGTLRAAPDAGGTIFLPIGEREPCCTSRIRGVAPAKFPVYEILLPNQYRKKAHPKRVIYAIGVLFA